MSELVPSRAVADVEPLTILFVLSDKIRPLVDTQLGDNPLKQGSFPRLGVR
jgi:hypothetical protein